MGCITNTMGFVFFIVCCISVSASSLSLYYSKPGAVCRGHGRHLNLAGAKSEVGAANTGSNIQITLHSFIRIIF